MQKGDTIRARFMTLPTKGRYIVAECGGVRETFFPEEVLT